MLRVKTLLLSADNFSAAVLIRIGEVNFSNHLKLQLHLGLEKKCRRAWLCATSVDGAKAGGRMWSGGPHYVIIA